jgi:amidohydrolase
VAGPLPPDDLRALVDARFDDAVDVRRDLHAHPELSHREQRTTTLVRDRLRALGFEELPCPTPTGAVFRLNGGRPGNTVLLRADLDALPLDEEVDVPWRSTVSGAMHACGHDGHTAILLGIAAALAQRAESLPGSYVLLFQPAEEDLGARGGGASLMLDGGVLDAVSPQRMVSLHLASLLATGLVGARAGIAMSQAQYMRIALSGLGGHGSMAGAAGNVVLAVSALSSGLPSVAEGLGYEDVSCACSAGVIRAGAAANVVPRSSLLEGTMRSFLPEQYDTMRDRLHALCTRVAADFDVNVETEMPPPVPPVVNDGTAVAAWRSASSAVLGADRVVDLPPMPPSDDVSLFLQRIPGVHFFVGAAPGRSIPPMHHAPDFTIDEESLRVGMLSMAATAVALADEATRASAG